MKTDILLTKTLPYYSLLFERLEPLLNYHPNCPGLLYDLLRYGSDFDPESTISYGKKALKYVDMYKKNTQYGADPAKIHRLLGNVYQEIGDHSSALVHLNKTLVLYKVYPERPGYALGIRSVKVQILESIRESKSVSSQLSNDTVSSLPVRTSEPITYEGETLPLHELFGIAYEKSWEERVPILKHIIAEAPRSEYAYYAGHDLAIYGENGKYIPDYPLLFKRLKPLLKFHPECPNLSNNR